MGVYKLKDLCKLKFFLFFRVNNSNIIMSYFIGKQDSNQPKEMMYFFPKPKHAATHKLSAPSVY